MIRKSGSQWEVVAHSGRSMGKFKTKKEAEQRLREIEYFKKKK